MKYIATLEKWTSFHRHLTIGKTYELDFETGTFTDDNGNERCIGLGHFKLKHRVMEGWAERVSEAWKIITGKP